MLPLYWKFPIQKKIIIQYETKKKIFIGQKFQLVERMICETISY